MLFRLVPTLLAASLASSELLSPGVLQSRIVRQQNVLEERHWKEPNPSESLECFQVTSPIGTQQGLAIGNRIVEKHESLPYYSMLLMNHSFGNSYGKPFVGRYEPPSYDFDNVFINITVASEGRQFDRLATMWLGDIEVWRTSTAEPTPKPGIVWYFLKDMSPYLSLWKTRQTIIFDLGNLINDKYTGPFNVSMEATFFQSSLESRRQPAHEPADLILPVSAKKSSQGSSSAFVFPGTKAEATVKLPRDVGTAILTIAATGQASEEFWWTNAPESAAGSFNSTGGDEIQGLSNFREVRIFIDDQVAGLAWPFPVVFTGGIAPPLHRPMVGLEAFDLRETEIDITPWLGILCDGQEHTIRMEVFGVNDTKIPEFAHVGSNWVLSGKIFTWLAPDEFIPSGSPQVLIGPMDYKSVITELNATTLDYTQSITRQITVRSNSEPYGKGAPNVEWSQSYTMVNDGMVRNSGYYQQFNSRYTGHGISRHGSESKLETQFRYPISTTYRYDIPHGQNGFSLDANLSQELDLAVTFDSPFATGAEPFIPRLHSGVRGSRLHARRDGHAYFSQGHRGPSIGAGQTSQRYELMALSPRDTDADVASESSPTLYKRSTTVANETIISDEEVIWDKTTIRVANRFSKDMVTEFAPIPLSRVGGMNPWIGGINQHHKNVRESNKMLGESLADQEATTFSGNLYPKPNRLVGDW